ncbi:MAG TPA: DNA alkylation repair protein [Terriglobales bacterium]|nr:DNA alkylation repair protein [Terriglobales bacterium]
MPVKTTVGEIQNRLEKLANARNASFLQRFFKTGPGEYGCGDRFRGIRVPVLRQLARQYRGITVTQARRLLRSRFHEDRLLALFILVHLFSKGDSNIRVGIYRLYLKNIGCINNWDLVDASAEHIFGPFLCDTDRRPLYRLVRSSSLWERRIAILATFHFIKRGYFAETLKIARLLLNDKEDLIWKAVGWMLREVGKRNPKAEEAFLRTHCKKMPRVMLRYAIERFPGAKRRRYLKGEV